MDWASETCPSSKCLLETQICSWTTYSTINAQATEAAKSVDTEPCANLNVQKVTLTQDLKQQGGL